MTDTSSQIKNLEEKAAEVLKLKHELGLRRPLVIEVCGTPKSGKTTVINALNIFLRRNGFNTSVVHEMAAVCPVRNKTDYFFNSWTLFSSLSETLKQLELKNDKADVVIIDRSIFDSLCWFHWLSTHPPQNPYIDQVQFDTFLNFLLKTKMWTSIFDITYILSCDPGKAMEREFASLITQKRGSIMNESVLMEFNQSIGHIKEKYLTKFQKVLQLDTTLIDAPVVSLRLTTDILENLKKLLTENIAYLLRPVVQIDLQAGKNNFDILLKQPLFFQERAKVEMLDDIQPIAIAVITNKERDRVLVIKKNEQKAERGSPEHKRLLLYLGGHVRQEDVGEEPVDNLRTFQNTIRRELKEEINENLSVGDQIPFLIYSPTNPKSAKHLAVCFVIEMDLENKSFKPTTDEFISKSGSTKSGQIILIRDIINSEEKLEPWSQEILRSVFNVENLSPQGSLFK